MPKFPTEEILALAIQWIPRIVLFFLVLIIGFNLASKVVRIMERRSKAKRINETSLKFFLSILKFFLQSLVLVIGLGILSIPMASITAVIGAATLSVGLALQGSLSNLAGGLVIVTFHPFQVGDFIESDGHSGTVEEVGILTTALRTVDGKRVILPNSLVSSTTLVNYSAYALRRVDVPVLVDYESNLPEVQRILRNLGESIEGSEEINVPVVANSDSGVELSLRLWVPKERYLETLYELQSKLKTTLDEAKIEIPYPHMKLIVEREHDEL